MWSSRCINCGLNVSRVKRHPLETETKDVHELIKKETGLTEILVNSVVCQACWVLLHKALESPGSCIDTIGHKHVCILCGKSVFRTRAHMVTKFKKPHAKEILQKRILSRPLCSSDQVCHSCWLVINRQANKKAKVKSVFTKNKLWPDTPGEVMRPDTNVCSGTSAEEMKSGANVSTYCQTDEQAININTYQSSPCQCLANTIHLSEYTRAPDSHSHCIFRGCLQQKICGIPLSIRVQLLKNYKYYVPRRARVCYPHLKSDSWENINNFEGSHTFTEAHINDFISFTRQGKSIDFENIDEMEERLVQYLLGVGKDEFHSLLSQVPELLLMRKGVTGCCVTCYLINNNLLNLCFFINPNSSLVLLICQLELTLKHNQSGIGDNRAGVMV